MLQIIWIYKLNIKIIWIIPQPASLSAWLPQAFGQLFLGLQRPGKPLGIPRIAGGYMHRLYRAKANLD